MRTRSPGVDPASLPPVHSELSWRERTRGLSFWARVKSLYPVEQHPDYTYQRVMSLRSLVSVLLTFGLGAPGLLLGALSLAMGNVTFGLVALAFAPFLALMPVTTFLRHQPRRGSTRLTSAGVRQVRALDEIIKATAALAARSKGMTEAAATELLVTALSERRTVVTALELALSASEDPALTPHAPTQHAPTHPSAHQVETQVTALVERAALALADLQVAASLELAADDRVDRALELLGASSTALRDVQDSARRTKESFVEIQQHSRPHHSLPQET